VVFPDIDPFVLGAHWQFDLMGRHWDIGLRWYALAYVAGILLGWRYVLGLVKNPKLWGPKMPTATPLQVDDLVLWVTLGVIVGGRLGSVLFYNTDMITNRPLEIFQIWKGGMSFHGGLIGVAIAIVLFARGNRIKVLAVADLVAAAEPIGQFFGRVANFINGELWGRTTTQPWGMVFCNDRLRYSDGTCAAGDVPRHPSQLYEAALEGVVLFFILRFATHRLKWLQKPGAVTGLFLIFYGLFRFVLEFVREPDENRRNLPLGLTMGMILSAPMILAGAWVLWKALTAPETAVAMASPAAAIPASTAAPKAKHAPAKALAPKPAAKAAVKAPAVKATPAKSQAKAKPKPRSTGAKPASKRPPPKAKPET
jgi:phosphatidylglycerol:prolipoprotein diacylglycerol transferase